MKRLYFSYLFSALCFGASAQPYAIDWHTIDGGGGTSTGGVYSVAGTIGQPDVSQQPMTGGNYSLTGGFWALFAWIQCDPRRPKWKDQTLAALNKLPGHLV